MMDHSGLSGSMVQYPGRVPRRFQTGRGCVEPGCRTRLSIYNRNDTCFRHSPVRFPRTRGRIVAGEEDGPRTSDSPNEARPGDLSTSPSPRPLPCSWRRHS